METQQFYPRNCTSEWRVIILQPDANKEHAEIAKWFWMGDLEHSKFTHTMVELQREWHMTAKALRQIQFNTCALQPPMGSDFQTTCAGPCGDTLNYVRCPSRSKFAEFRSQRWWCAKCGATERARYAEEMEILTVREFTGCSETGHSLFRCECLCGEIITARGSDLTAGTKRRCGPDCKYEPLRPRFNVRTIYDHSSTTKFSK